MGHPMASDALTQAGWRLADAERAFAKELERVYGADAKHARHWHHTDPTLLAIVGERNAASVAYHGLLANHQGATT